MSSRLTAHRTLSGDFKGVVPGDVRNGFTVERLALGAPVQHEWQDRRRARRHRERLDERVNVHNATVTPHPQLHCAKERVQHGLGVPHNQKVDPDH